MLDLNSVSQPQPTPALTSATQSTHKLAVVRSANDASLRRHTLASLTGAFLLCGVVGGWAATSELSGAIVAPGQLVVDSNVKKVQHPTGGVVGEVLVRDGSVVKAGDLLVRLDATVTQSNLAIITKGLDEARARQARLEAERDDRGSLTMPASLTDRKDDENVARILSSEQRLFQLRRDARFSKKEQLVQRIERYRQEISGLNGQIKAKEDEMDIMKRELRSVRDLWQKNLISIQRITALERDSVRMDGQKEQVLAARADSGGKIVETELQILQVDQDFRSDVAKELRDTQAKISELSEREISARDMLARIDIRSPQDGVVYQSTVHTVGGVIAPGEALMSIVPNTDELVVEAKVPPQEIDQLKLGLPATIRFSTFNQHTTPELEGVVTVVAPDITLDETKTRSYYSARVKLLPGEIDRLDGLKLVPGMPSDVFIKTGDRTVLSYLTKPFSDQFKKAFRRD